MRTIKTYFKGAPFYNAFIKAWIEEDGMVPSDEPQVASEGRFQCPQSLRGLVAAPSHLSQ
jgi:hypothetical protein